jgi:ribose transport system substrate-binding protein
MTSPKDRSPYVIPVLSKALDILEAFQSDSPSMTLEEIRRHTKIPKSTVYRVIRTLIHRGYLSESSDGRYRLAIRPKKLRFGYGQMSSKLPFSVEVTRSLKEAANSLGVDLMILDNRLDGPTALRNADKFVAAGVDLVVEFQRVQEVASSIADKISRASIPIIAVDIPHPHATFYGVDNYRVGFEAGEVLANHANTVWRGEVDWVLGLDVAEAGILVQSRISGAFDAIRRDCPDFPAENLLRLDVRGLREKSAQVVFEFLQQHPFARHVLIATVNDSCALGALDAVHEAGREGHVAIVGQDCIAEVIEEMKKPETPLIGSVSHETASYGPNLIRLGLEILQGKTVAPYNYVLHRVVTRGI